MSARTGRKKVAVTADIPTVANALNALEQRVFETENNVSKTTDNLILLEGSIGAAVTSKGTSGRHRKVAVRPKHHGRRYKHSHSTGTAS